MSEKKWDQLASIFDGTTPTQENEEGEEKDI